MKHDQHRLLKYCLLKQPCKQCCFTQTVFYQTFAYQWMHATCLNISVFRYLFSHDGQRETELRKQWQWVVTAPIYTVHAVAKLWSWLTTLKCLLCFVFQAELSDWSSHEHNMGLAFDRVTWNKIKRCSEVCQDVQWPDLYHDHHYQCS